MVAYILKELAPSARLRRAYVDRMFDNGACVAGLSARGGLAAAHPLKHLLVITRCRGQSLRRRPPTPLSTYS